MSANVQASAGYWGAASGTHATRKAMQTLFTIVLAVAGLLGSAAPARAAAEEAVRPNVVLVVVDALRGGHLTASRNGAALMPKAHALARQSVWYTNAHSQESWTMPSMASIFTSLYPESHGVQYQRLKEPGKDLEPHIRGLPGDLKTMAAHFKDAGYFTVGIQTNPHLQDFSGFAAGFDRYEFYYGAHGERVTAEAIRNVSEAPEPYFLYVHYFDTHAPYVAHPPYGRTFGPAPEIAPWEQQLIDSYLDYYDDLVEYECGMLAKEEFKRFSEAGRAHIRYLYDAEAAYADAQVAHLFHLLTFLGKLDDKDVLILTADHGEELWEHGSVGHRRTVYQELLHIPLVFRLPGVAPRKLDAPVESIDILPTLAAFLGFPADPGWQGRNLLPLLEAETTEARPVFAQAHGSMPWLRLHWNTVILDGRKLIVDDTRGEAALYDLSADPGETRNMAEEAGQLVSKLRALLEQHHTANRAHPSYDAAGEAKPLPEDIVEKLRALGYVD